MVEIFMAISSAASSSRPLRFSLACTVNRMIYGGQVMQQKVEQILESRGEWSAVCPSLTLPVHPTFVPPIVGPLHHRTLDPSSHQVHSCVDIN